jgi:hypothetical protein
MRNISTISVRRHPPVSGAATPSTPPPCSAWLAQHLEGFAGPLSVEMFKGGQSNPTYKLITPGAAYVMRAKPGPVAKLLPSAHAIEREFRVMKRPGRHRRAGGAHACAVRGRIRHRPRLLRHGVHRGPRAVGPVPARHDAGRARRHLRRDEPRHRRAAQVDVAARAWPTTASRATTSSARSAAGASSTWPPSPSPSPRWTG